MYILDFLPGHKKNLFILPNDEEAKKYKNKTKKSLI